MNNEELSSAATTITMTFLKLIYEFDLNFYIDKRGNFIYEDPESKKAAIIDNEEFARIMHIIKRGDQWWTIQYRESMTTI